MNATHASQQLHSGVSIKANLRSLHPDLAQGVIWGTDEYGCDVVFSSGTGDSDGFIQRAVKWLVSKPDPQYPHPAEFAA